MRTYFQPLLISVAISSLSATAVWAISPDGGSAGSRPTPSVSAPAAAPSSAPPASRSGGKPILSNSATKEDYKKHLDIGQPKTKNLTVLKAEGFGSMVEFETDSDIVIPSRGLEVILSALLDLEPDASIEIVGHTDNVGNASYNMDLSRRRAESVRRWFESRGVRPGAIRTRGAGLHEPIDTNSTEAGRRRNRRVEFARIYE